MKRPFWMHQLVEYVIGVLLVSQGLQAAEPLIPALLGGLILTNAATAKGPLGAFPRVPRPLHRVFDLVVLGLLVLGAVAPTSMIDQTARIVVIGVAAVYAFVILRSDYAARPTRSERRAAKAAVVAAPASDRSEAIGRAAGRTAGSLYNAARKRRRP